MAFKLPKTYDKWLKIDEFLNPKRWHLTHFVVQNLCKKSWFVQKQAWRATWFCEWKPWIRLPLLEDHFFTQKCIFFVHKKRIFYEKTIYFLWYKSNKNTHFFTSVCDWYLTLYPKLDLKKSIQKALNFSVF